jgi:predicted transcriptional regulator
MAGRSVSGYVDDKVAERLNDVARMESRSPANIVAQALGFYVALPEAARTSLRRIEATALPQEMQWFQTEFIRLLFKVDMGLTQRQMAKEIGAGIPDVSTEEDLEQASNEWTANLGR